MINFFKKILDKIFRKTPKYSYCLNCNQKVPYQKTCPFCTSQTIKIIERSECFEIRQPSGGDFMMEKFPSKTMFNWNDAKLHAQNLKKGGYSKGWRLPDRKELQTIFQIKDICKIDESLEWFWSSDTLPNNQNRAWYMIMKDGNLDDDDKSHELYACCVK